MFARQKKKTRKKQSKLVKRYIHTKGFFKLSGKSPKKKSADFTRNQIVLVIFIIIFIIPGIYFCFF
jgi:hypothetical protein